MNDSAEIRKLNKLKINKLLLSGSVYSKQQIAQETGLSLATSNTLLNEMENGGEVLGEKRRVSEVGPGTVFYRLNEDHESFLCLYFDALNSSRILDISVKAITGKEKLHLRREYSSFEKGEILKEISEVLGQFPNISQIVIGIPGLFTNGKIEHCDAFELEGWECQKELEELFGIPAYIENDMYLKAYGYYKKGKKEQIVTLAYFPENLLPGTVTVGHDIIWKGADQFAGMVGFLPFGIDREEIKRQLRKGSCLPIISKAVASIIVMMNPDTIICSGDLVDEETLGAIKESIKKWIPEPYVPEFIYEDGFKEIYGFGMYQKALALKEEKIR